MTLTIFGGIRRILSLPFVRLSLTGAMPSEPKHRRISHELLAEIAAGKYGPSGRLPSEAQLVKRFQVSRPTIARALRDLQDQGLIERRVGSGSYVSSRPPGAPSK